MTNTITVLDTDFATVVCYPDHRIIHHTFHKPGDGKPFQDVLTKALDAFKQYGAIKWLSDDRKHGVLSDEDNQWGINEWVVGTMNAGWKYWAILVPDEIQGRASMMDVIEDFHKRGVKINLFSSVDKALDWLKSVD